MITFTSTGRGQRSSWPTDSCFSAQRTAAPGRVGQALTHLPDAEAVCTAGCGRTSCCWTLGRVLLVRHAGHDDGWSTLSEGTPNLDGLGCHIAGRLEGPRSQMPSGTAGTGTYRPAADGRSHRSPEDI